MAQQNRGFRNFMMDPKGSVMTYLADNLPPDHRPQTQLPANQQAGSSFAPQNQAQQNQNQQPYSSVSHSQPNGTVVPSQTTQSAPPNSVQSQHTLVQGMQPCLASNLSRPTTPSMQQLGEHQPMGSTPVNPLQVGPTASMDHTDLSQQNTESQVPAQDPIIKPDQQPLRGLGLNSPPTGPRKRIPLQSAQRVYHRLILSFEGYKNAFFLAKSRNDVQTLVSSAYELETVAHRIWSLRFEHSAEFEDYNETGHQIVITHWQGQYELWADTVADIQEQEGDFNRNSSAPSQLAPINVTTKSHGSGHLPYPSPDNAMPHYPISMQAPSAQIQQQPPSEQVGRSDVHIGQDPSNAQSQQPVPQLYPSALAAIPPAQANGQNNQYQQRPLPPSQRQEPPLNNQMSQNPGPRVQPNGPGGQNPPPGAWQQPPTNPTPPSQQQQQRPPGPNRNQSQAPIPTQGFMPQQQPSYSNGQPQLVAGMQHLHLPNGQMS